ncbi:MAG: DNA-binding protein [Anaerolineae bacterium]|nr:DNA-binding protein [Anaerolineae bacterium]
MKSKLIDDQHGRKSFVMLFDKGEEFIAGLETFADDQELNASHFTAIGAFSVVTLGYFDRETMSYKEIPVHEQVEVLSLIGNITLNKSKPKIHAHVVLGRSDGTTRGGHVLTAHIWPTLEVIVVESPQQLQRKIDEATGLALLEIS